jgi:hypothetical protein
MDGMETVVADELDLGEAGEFEGAAGSEGDVAAEAGADAGAEEKVDGRKGSREFRAALKAWEATPEGALYAKQAQSDNYRINELNQLEPGGISALRETYALLAQVGGKEAVVQLQERVGAADATDAALEAGDPKVFESMGPEFDPGLAKLTPALLERVMKVNPEAYAAAILPHLMSSLSGSPLLTDLNRMVDSLRATHLDDAGKIKAITGILGKIGAWWDHNEKKAGELKTAPANKAQTDLDEQRSKFEVEQQAAHWKNNIAPVVGSYEKTKLEEHFKPFDNRLKLDPAAKADLFATFKERMKAAALADAAYMKQMAIYRKQKNPDPAVVANFVKSAINRHSKSVVDNAVNARYGRFLGGARAKPPVVPGSRAAAATGGVAPTIVGVRPSTDDVDYHATSEEDQYKGIYTLKNGKRVQVRRSAGGLPVSSLSLRQFYRTIDLSKVEIATP